MQAQFSIFSKLFLTLVKPPHLYYNIPHPIKRLRFLSGPQNREARRMIQQDEMRGGVKVCDLVEHLQLAVVNKGDDFDTALVGIRDVNRPKK